MTIAVTAVVRPSNLLLAAVGLICAGILAAAAGIGSGMTGDLAPGTRAIVAGLCASIAIFGFFQAIRSRKTFRIDISGVGQIRLVEDNGAAGISHSGRPDQRGSGEIVQLMADSTIWPHMLCLRLKGPRGITQLVVLPDSITADGFRSLSVACRWIAAHNNRAEGKPV